MLERFRQAKESEINNLRIMAELGFLPAPCQTPRPDFTSAISQSGRIAVIAEYKRASPSLGEIRSDLTVEEVASQYAESGASAMSILTETRFFRGNLAYISRAANTGLPILRKDFIFDELQVVATAATPAAAMLLIVRCLPDASLLRGLREKAEKFGIACVVEIFDADDLKLARESGATIIQANARDLNKLEVDQTAPLRLIREYPPLEHEVWIAASGIASGQQIKGARDAGYKAALIGTSLMKAPKPGHALANLIKDGENAG